MRQTRQECAGLLCVESDLAPRGITEPETSEVALGSILMKELVTVQEAPGEELG